MNNYIMKGRIGQFGNNLIQASNGLILAAKNKGKFTLPEHIRDVVRPLTADFSDGAENLPDIKNNFWDIWSGRQDNYHGFVQIKAFDNIYEVEKLRPDVLRNFILPAIPSPTTPIKCGKEHKDVSEYDVVAHVRGDDKFVLNGKRHVVQPGDVQCPFSYFIKIFKDFNYNNILVVYQDDHNPVMKKLKSCKDFNLHFQSSSLLNDVNTILHAKNFIISGHTSFSRLLMQTSTNVEQIFVPYLELMDNFPFFNFDSECIKPKVHKLFHHNYMSWGGENGWKNQQDQYDLMLNYEESNIQYINTYEDSKAWTG